MSHQRSLFIIAVLFTGWFLLPALYNANPLDPASAASLNSLLDNANGTGNLVDNLNGNDSQEDNSSANISTNMTETAEVQATPYRYVKVQGRQLMVDFDQDGAYEPYFIRGVGYEPYPVGRHVSDWGWPANYPRPNNIFDEPAALERDFNLLEAMNANTIRIWRGEDHQEISGQYPVKLTDNLLQYAQLHHIKVIAGFWFKDAYPGDWSCDNVSGTYQSVYHQYADFTNTTFRTNLKNGFRAYVTQFKNRPEILFWAVGNEESLHFNRSNPTQVQAYYSLVNEMGQIVREVEGATTYHPIAVVNGDIDFIGETGFGATDADLPYLDIWGSNVYLGQSFGTLFSDYQAKSQKPFWIAEYGADAFYSPDWHSPAVGYEDQTTQAQWDGGLWEEIAANSRTAIGGTVMAYSDEWWKINEWWCEDPETYDYCNERIASQELHLSWDSRPNATSYALKIGTWFDGNNIYDSSVGSVTSKNITSSALLQDNGTIYIQLKYQIPTQILPIIEYLQYPTQATQTQSFSSIKLKEYGMVHNHFAFTPQDQSCPPDGTLDFIPALPDNVAHEEWWGIMSISRNGYDIETMTPRTAYYTLQDEFLPLALTLSSGSPSGVLPFGTTQTTLSLNTNRKAWCWYDTASGTPFYSMTNKFTTTGAMAHSQPITGLANGSARNYYIRCQDTAGNMTTTDYPVSFSVDTVARTYDQWKTAKFSLAEQNDPTKSGESVDRDTDGIINLREYAFNLDPLVSDASDGFSAVLIDGKVRLKFRKYIYATDLNIETKTSNNLMDPVSSWTAMNQTTTDLGNNTVEVTAHDALAPMTSSRFAIFRITRTLPSGGQIVKSMIPAMDIKYSLKVTVSGQGSVSSSSGKINCGSSCDTEGLKNTTDILTANPATGFKLNTWSGCSSVNGNTCTANYDAPKTVTASFIDAIPPTGAFIINGNANTTNTRDVVLDLLITDPGSGVSQMRFKECSSTCSSWTNWETFSSPKLWKLTTSGNGYKTMTAQVTDMAGNSMQFTDRILLSP